MDKEKDDIEFDELLAEKRHKELTGLLKGIATQVSKPSDNSLVAKAIENNTKEIGNFGKQLSELEIKVEAPNVNVKTDLTELSKEIKGLKECQERIEKLLEEQNGYFAEMCKPKDFEFEFSRNNYGILQSPIKAKQKVIKTKYQA